MEQQHHEQPGNGIWLDPERKVLSPNEDLICCDSPGALLSCLQERIQRWYDETSQSVLFIALDGLPGSGKSSFIKPAIENMLARTKRDVSVHTLSLDDFIGTDPNNSLRALRLTSAELFWKYLYCRICALQVISAIIVSQGNKIDIPLQRIYDKDLRSGAKGVIHFAASPKGRRIMIIDGVNSINLTGLLGRDDNKDFSVVKIMTMSRPEESLKRAVNRDLHLQNGAFERRSRMRTAEYNFMVPKVYEVNAGAADLLVRIGR